MSSRITTILNKFKLEERFCINTKVDNSLFTLIDDIKNDNPERTHKIIKNEQYIAKEFLAKVFNN